jgi:integrase
MVRTYPLPSSTIPEQFVGQTVHPMSRESPPPIAVMRLLECAGRHRVGRNLYLQVRSPGAGSWLFRYMRDGRAHWMGLGTTRAFSLADARKRAQKQAQLLADKVDPLHARRKDDATKITFGKCAHDYVTAHAPSWKNAKHIAQWRTTFEGSMDRPAATAVINDLAVGSIDTELALNVLQPIWARTPETASRIRQRCELVLGWATARQFRSGANPFAWRGHLDKLLPKPSALKKLKGDKHHPALPHTEMPSFMEELRRKDFISARALEFTILTASRTNEVINASWDEIDLAEKTWTVPAKRMKAGKEHRVPLSARTLQILSELSREDGNRFLFIGAKSEQPLSNMAMLELMKGLRPGFVPHGFRATFRTWAAECTSYPHHVCEAALAHTIPDAVVRSYQRGDMFNKRRKLMDAWAKFCGTPVAAVDNITPIRQKA